VDYIRTKWSIRATLVEGAERHWSAQAEFLADAQGDVDVSRQAPVKGSYNEVSALGLVWSMKPEEKNVARYESPHDLSPQIIQFQLLEADKQVASAQFAQFEQLAVADGVREIKIQGELHGVLLVPGASRPHPGIIVVGGSEGGIPLQKAAWLASHGFAAYALPYFR